GDAIVERLEAFNEKERYYTYSIMQAAFPLLIFASHFGQYTYRSSIFSRSIICNDTILILHMIPIKIRLTMSSITSAPSTPKFYHKIKPIL
ncbi:hypothetical protein ACT4UT_16580, partial [Bacillus sp. B-TM1]